MTDQVKNLMIYQLNSFFSICKLPLHIPLFQAAACYWEPKLHVFRFNDEELCPTFEEFLQILEIDLDREPAIPDSKDWYFKDLMTLSMLFKVQTSKTLQDHMINFTSLIHHFSPHRNLRDSTFNTIREGSSIYIWWLNLCSKTTRIDQMTSLLMWHFKLGGGIILWSSALWKLFTA